MENIEAVLEEEEEEYEPSLEIFSGSCVILNLEEFKQLTKAIAVHVTEESGVNVLVVDGNGNLTWKSYPYKEPDKKKSSLTPIKN